MLWNLLTVLVGRLVPMPAPPAVEAALTEVVVVEREHQPAAFALTFAARDPEATALLAMSELAPFSRVVLTVHVGDLDVVLMDGVITQRQVSEANVTLIGEDLTALMDFDRKDIVVFPGLTAAMQVAVILSTYMPYGVVSEIIPAAEAPGAVPPSPNRRESDLAYLERLAADAGYIFYLRPGPRPCVSTAYWGPRYAGPLHRPLVAAGASWLHFEDTRGEHATGVVETARYGGVLQLHGSVEVRGTDNARDGRFEVTAVTHTIVRDDYRQRFSLGREPKPRQ